MKRQRYRCRDGNSLGSVVNDAAHVASWFGPVGALIVGGVGFVCFYVALPLAVVAWLDFTKLKLSSISNLALVDVLDKIIFHRLIESCQWAGTAILVVCAGIAVWKYATGEEPTRAALVEASMLAKLVARLLSH